ncbi:hypothetical protein QCA50_020062 [Cerrena zonata]|uniref:Cytochrome P450 n=1 Tax=Cerrena zonata TaxID=2478898 RepID=A0AAW0FFQ4_9APHY
MSVIQALAIVVAVWGLWRLLRNYFIRSPLDNIPGPQPASILQGNFGQLFDRHGWNFQDELGEKYQSVVKLQNTLGRKALFVFDPRAMHNIIVKEQYTYEPADWVTTSLSLVTGPGVLATYGELHRRQRKMLNPVFSINHMRHLTPIFYEVAHRLRDGIENQIKTPSKDGVDMLRWMHRTALELVGQGGLGHSFDPLSEDVPYNDYAKAMKELSAALFNLALERLATPYLVKMGPSWLRRWLLERVPSKRVQRLKDIADILDENAKGVLSEKRAALKAGDTAIQEDVSSGKDIMSILLRDNSAASEEDRLSEEELLGQMSIIVFAATSTTTIALAQTFHLLAENLDVQDKLRNEIREAKLNAGGDIPHDELMALPYLDAVCRETLRLYPPVTFIMREARKDAVLPLSQPITGMDGQMMSEIHVPKATTIVIGIRASNLSRAVWGKDAKEWKPERWLGKMPEEVVDARIPGVYSNVMTFSGGGRSCIGFKFSNLEMKVVLAVLLESFRFEMTDKEVIWNMAGVKYPTVGKGSSYAEFPMRVTAVV